MSKISYSAVVLDEQSALKLKQEFKAPDGWEWVGHHMTIKMGELPEQLKSKIGESADLLAEEIGIDELAMAVKVNDRGLSTNDIPHITLAVNRSGGGKPFHSNKIPAENWKPIVNRFVVSGIIQEIPQHKS